MILKNQRTREELELKHEEFLSKFYKELQEAFLVIEKQPSQKVITSALMKIPLNQIFTKIYNGTSTTSQTLPGI